jgi:putative ABC transport system permease protein
MELWIGAVNLGLLYAFMALGTFITYKIFDFPDITVDGSFTLGAAVVSFMMMSGVNHLIALPLVFLSGMIAGAVTGLIHTKFRINGLPLAFWL